VLELTLDALCTQTASTTAFEVIVVDDGAEPPLAARLQPYGHRLCLHEIRREGLGPGAARNAGAELAQSGLLIFLDDDCVPDSGWLESYLAAHSAAPTSALAGPIANGIPDDINAEAYHLIFGFLYSRHIEHGGTSAPFVISANFAVPAALFRSVGGFDARFRVASEDRMFSEDWLRSGKTVRAVPGAIVRHHRPLTLMRFWAQQYRYGRGGMILRKALVRRGWTPRPLENSSFYFNLLSTAFHHPNRSDRVPLFLRLVLSQAAIAAGHAAELFSAPLSPRHVD
jgi:GT2 family glycosyltransferase